MRGLAGSPLVVLAGAVPFFSLRRAIPQGKKADGEADKQDERAKITDWTSSGAYHGSSPRFLYVVFLARPGASVKAA
jgi:hypothetical protein